MLPYIVCHKMISNSWSYTELLNQPICTFYLQTSKPAIIRKLGLHYSSLNIMFSC